MKRKLALLTALFLVLVMVGGVLPFLISAPSYEAVALGGVLSPLTLWAVIALTKFAFNNQKEDK